MNQYEPASKPTFYFIGVTTGKSSIMKVFPEWAEYLDLGDVSIKGMDFQPHSDLKAYRAAVEFIKHDPKSLGALVTTHKIDLFDSCRDLFELIDPHARFMGETSCISKNGDSLVCHAKDPISSGLALDGFLPPSHFAESGADLFSMGAGGSTIALTWHLMQVSRGANRPGRVIVSNRSQPRLDEIKRIHKAMDTDVATDYVLAETPAPNDEVLASLQPGSLVINATGLGKDTPGSPLTDKAKFPANAIVWDLNYRGDLVFLDQAQVQGKMQSLQIEDGWTYFIHGWTQVIAEVFKVDIPMFGPRFDALSEIASKVGRPGVN